MKPKRLLAYVVVAALLAAHPDLAPAAFEAPEAQALLHLGNGAPQLRLLPGHTPSMTRPVNYRARSPCYSYLVRSTTIGIRTVRVRSRGLGCRANLTV